VGSVRGGLDWKISEKGGTPLGQNLDRTPRTDPTRTDHVTVTDFLTDASHGLFEGVRVGSVRGVWTGKFLKRGSPFGQKPRPDPPDRPLPDKTFHF